MPFATVSPSMVTDVSIVGLKDTEMPLPSELLSSIAIDSSRALVFDVSVTVLSVLPLLLADLSFSVCAVFCVLPSADAIPVRLGNAFPMMLSTALSRLLAKFVPAVFPASKNPQRSREKPLPAFLMPPCPVPQGLSRCQT